MWYQGYEYDRMRKLSEERQRIACGLLTERDFPDPADLSDLSEEELERHIRNERTQKIVAQGPSPEDVYKWARSVAGDRPYRIMVSTLPETVYNGGRIHRNMVYIVRDLETDNEIDWINGYLL